MILLSHPATAQCPNGEDYFPCDCLDRDPPDSLPEIRCNNGSSVEQLVDLFNRTIPAEWKAIEIFFALSPDANSGLVIPRDLLGDHRSHKIIAHVSYNTIYPIKFDPQTFRSSKNTTEIFQLDFCDMSRLDFQFLSGFDQLSSLYIFIKLQVLNQPIGHLSRHCPDWTIFLLLQGRTWIIGQHFQNWRAADCVL